MFWVATEPDGPSVVIESDTRPKMTYDGGIYNSTSTGCETLEDLHAKYGMTDRCRECDSLINTAWMEPTRSRLIAERLCFSCDHWLQRIARGDSPLSAVIEGRTYTINPKESDPPSCRGFGGAMFTIAFFDGREVVTRNLWTGGDIPARFRERLPDNARFKKEQTK